MEVADKMSDRLLSLPMYPEITMEQIDYIVKQLEAFVKFGAR